MNHPQYGSTHNALVTLGAKDLAVLSVVCGLTGVRMFSLGAGLEVGEDGRVFVPR